VSFFAEQCRGSTSAARSCLFVCSSTVVYMGHYERPHFPPKVFLAAPTINVGYRNSNRRHAASHVDWPSRILLTVRPARQDAVLLRHMTTTVTALGSRQLAATVGLLVNIRPSQTAAFPTFAA